MSGRRPNNEVNVASPNEKKKSIVHGIIFDHFLFYEQDNISL